MTSTHNFTTGTDHNLVPLFVAKPRALSRLTERGGRRQLVTMSKIFHQHGPCFTISYGKSSQESMRRMLHFSDVPTNTMVLQIPNAKDNAAQVLVWPFFPILNEEALLYVLHCENIKSSLLICNIFFGPGLLNF